MFNYHKILEKVKNLSSNWDKYTAPDREKIMNKIDKEATELLISAKKSCRKLRTRAVFYSPELSKLELT